MRFVFVYGIPRLDSLVLRELTASVNLPIVLINQELEKNKRTVATEGST